MASTDLTRLLDNLLNGFGQSKRQYKRERTSFPSGDVEFDIERLSTSVYFWTSGVETAYPCAVDSDGPVPIMMTFMGKLFPSGWEGFPEPAYYLFLEGTLNFYETKNVNIVKLSVNDLRSSLRERLSRFLSVRSREDEAPTPRFATAVGAAPAGFTTRSNPYLDLEVHTHESELRIHYTPSYFIDWTNVFGSLTTPSTGWILPGRYKFGAMRANGDFLIDKGNFDVPPTTAAHLVLR